MLYAERLIPVGIEQDDALLFLQCSGLEHGSNWSLVFARNGPGYKEALTAFIKGTQLKLEVTNP